MSVNLQKGQKVDLTKGNSSLKKIVIGLGWDAAEKKGGGLLGGLFGGNTQDIDCDASAIVCGSDKKLITKQVLSGQNKLNTDVVYFGNLSHSSGSIRHMGDNLTGDGVGDDEQIIVNLQSVPAQYESVFFVVNIYKAIERKQHFGMIKNAFIRVVDADTNKELCKYNLSENYDGMTAMVFGEIYKHQGEWKFNAIGQGTNDTGISQTVSRYI